MSHPNGSSNPMPRRPAVPVDFAAVLSAMQDQLDALAAVVEAQQRRLEILEQGSRPEQTRKA